MDGHKANVVNLLANVKVYQLSFFPHHVHPNNELVQNRNFSDDDTDRSRIYSTYPIPLITQINSTIEDNVALKLVEQKCQHIYDVNKASTCFVKANSK